MHKIAETLKNPRVLLWFYIVLFIVFCAMTWICSPLGTEWGMRLAKSVAYVTFISHLALVLTMIGAIAAQLVAVAVDEDADVQDAVEVLEKLDERLP